MQPAAPGMNYCTGTEIVRIGQDRLVARTSCDVSLMSAGFLASGALVFSVAALGSWVAPSLFIRYGPLSGDWFPITAVILGLMFIMFGLSLLGSTWLVFDRGDRVLTCKKAIKGIGRRIPLDDIEALEIVPDDSATYSGKIDLVLFRPGGWRLGVVMRKAEDQLLRDASALAEFIGVPVRDTRQVVVPVSLAGSGKQITVSRCFKQPNWALRFRHHALVKVAEGLLAVEETRLLQGLRGLVMAVGLCVLAFGLVIVGVALLGIGDGLAILLHSGAVCLAVGAALVWAALRILTFPSVSIDRTRDEVRGEKLRVGGRLVKRLPLRSVAAVQIALFREYNFPRYTIYEINLVFSQPPGERLTLMAHSREKRIRADAQRLAEFLNVPLMDHSAGDGETIA
jgi:hypothetical protein